jgi:hypothetical protein
VYQAETSATSDLQAGSGRKTPEIAGTWKQYSGRKLSGFFQVDSCQFHVLFDRNRLKIIGKNTENFRSEYCLHVPAISGVFLQDTAAGIVNLRIYILILDP